MTRYQILRNRRVEVNTDPQRRCYDGVNAKSEMQWTGWEVLETDLPEDRIDQRLKFWRELNEYAVSQRGEGARIVFRSVPVEESANV